MDLLYIAIAVFSIVIGITLSFLIKKSKVDNTPVVENNEDSRQLGRIMNTEIEDLKNKYEGLLSESKVSISNLETQLSAALQGKFDEVSKERLAEIDKLKKKVKNLEDELSDLEDDLSDEKKKTKKKDSEIDALHTSLSDIQRESKSLKDKVLELDNILNEKAEELSLKNESLMFVQEVLSAKDASDDQTEELFSRVSDIASFIMFDLRDNVKEIYDITQELDDSIFGSGLLGWSARKKKSWLSGKVSIAFVGEFSAGKTSIVNRILSQDDPSVPLLPVSTKATTAIPTYISGSDGARYQFVSRDNSLKQITEDTFKKVNKEVLDQIRGVSELIKYFVMGYKNPNLNNLSILDTPGFNSNDPEDADRTIEVINECDALFWVFDVNAGTVNRSSLQLIKDHLTKPLYIVINKVDTKPTSEVDKVESLISKTLVDAEIKYEKILRFSSKAPLSDIMTPISSIERDESQDNYIDDLKELLSDWLKELNNQVIEEKRSADALDKKMDSIVDKYNNATRLLGDDCQSASEIPQYKSGFLGIGEGYKMTTAQYDEMINTLERICTNRVDTLVDNFNEMVSTINEFRTASDNHANARYHWQLLNDTYEKLVKITKDI